MHAQKTRDAAAVEVPSRSFPLWLFALFLLAFSFGTDDLVIAGVLPDIARDLDVSVAASGQLVTVFALTFALGAPVAAALTARWPRRAVLAGAALVFVLANVGAAVAPGYGTVLVARIVAGLAAATASPAAFAVAAAAAPEGRRGRFLAVVSAGMTTSLVAGVPAGTWIGDALGWRATMLYVAALAAVAGLVLLGTLPGLPGAEPSPVRERLRVLRRPGTAVALVAMIPAGAGGMMSYVYITEIAGRLGDVRGAAVAPVITAAGVAGIVGAFLGGRAVDAFGAPKALVVFMAGVTAAPVSMAVLGAVGGPYHAVVVGGVFVLYGLATWGIAPATQAWLLDRSGPDAAGELLAVNNACMYLGFSLAGAVGGLALGAGGAAAVPVAAAGCAALSLLLFGAALMGRREDA
ncbi:MFS transporter [Actinomadura algeriensis]|uniref:MFS family arabinose efflux permease n=1 Tax=Actinomadura algeriensis TaxID=1679523 RepID=A0ABR9JQI9_9ACTN|nr:MFS transporter [Actinomadura algeriensis]MBE1532753.1 putative MFS family arabinose efflux permease [Actinomadura algeriensis]